MVDRIDEQPEPRFPERLARACSRLYPPGPPVPPGIDEEILARARAHFARHRRLRLMIGWAGAAGAAAAVILLALWPGQPGKSRRPVPAPTSLTIVREDIDGNGQVDIRDALALARQIEAGGDREPAHFSATPASGIPDLTGDGQVDRADVDVVAMAAVSLERGSLQ